MSSERVTSSDLDIEVPREGRARVIKASRHVKVISLRDLRTPDMEDPAAIPPLQAFRGQGSISVEVSRRRAGLPFFHRNLDADELIVCLTGRARWETEEGTFNVEEGQAILIPRGIAHRPAEVSGDYLAMEIKVSGRLDPSL